MLKLKLFQIRIFFVAFAIVVTLASLYFSFQILNPTPPRVVTFATGPEGGAYERLGEMYKEILAESGVEVRLQSTDGSLENLALLSNGGTDLGFITMGEADEEAAETLRSLGAMFVEPLWVFTRDPLLREGDFRLLDAERTSIGPENSQANNAARDLLELLGRDPDELPLLEIGPAEAADKLLAAELDTVFLIENSISPIIKRLISDPELVLVDFARADAHVALYPRLTKLVVPAGVGSLSQNLPAQDTRVLAFTTIVATREDLHPITQSLFLEAASQIHGDPDLFHTLAGEFPKPTDQLVLLSDSARAYYSEGRPFLLQLLPYWLAIVLMQLMAAVIPLVGVVYPMLRLMPSAFHWIIRNQFHRLYTELRSIDQSITTSDARQLSIHLERLEQLEGRVTTLRVPVTYASMLYALKAHISSVLSRVRTAEKELSSVDRG